MTEITKCDWCVVTERVWALVNQEELLRKCMQKKSQITRNHHISTKHLKTYYHNTTHLLPQYYSKLLYEHVALLNVPLMGGAREGLGLL